MVIREMRKCRLMDSRKAGRLLVVWGYTQCYRFEKNGLTLDIRGEENKVNLSEEKRWLRQT